jgi:hypothetical protein
MKGFRYLLLEELSPHPDQTRTSRLFFQKEAAKKARTDWYQQVGVLLVTPQRLRFLMKKKWAKENRKGEGYIIGVLIDAVLVLPCPSGGCCLMKE